MKVIFLLFLVLILYSFSQDAQYISIGNSLSSLRVSKLDDYLYFTINNNSSYSYLLVFLLGDSYKINNLSYCYSDSYNETGIKSCSFKYIDYYDYDDYNTETSPSSFIGYYYRIYISTSRYLIIKYCGSYNYTYSKLKVKGTYTPFLERIEIDSGNLTELYPLQDINNYFYVYIKHSRIDYLYFYFRDPNDNLKDPIYYCKTTTIPHYYTSTLKDCKFLS